MSAEYSQVAAPSQDSTKPVFDPYYDSLTGQEGRRAVEGQLRYAQVVRRDTDEEIPGQKFALFSRLIYSKPMERGPHKIVGLFKIRGFAATEMDAKHLASKIIKNVDSTYEILIAPVGAWTPLTGSSIFTKEQYDVKTEQDLMALRDEASKQKQEETERKMREIKEREEQLKNPDTDPASDPGSLHSYVVKRRTEMDLRTEIKTKLKHIATLREAHRKAMEMAYALDQEYPSYQNEWIDYMNEVQAKVGIPAFKPAADEFDEYMAFCATRANRVIDRQSPDAASSSSSSLPVTEKTIPAIYSVLGTDPSLFKGVDDKPVQGDACSSSGPSQDAEIPVEIPEVPAEVPADVNSS